MQNRRTFTLRAAQAALAIAAPVGLTACGFKLKGAVQLPFQSLYFDAAAKGPVAIVLRKQLQASTGLQLISNAAQMPQAQLRLKVLRDEQARSVVNANTYGLALEVKLFVFFYFQLLDDHGDPVGAPIELEQRRNLNYNESTPLAKGAEEQMLYTDMNQDLAQQVMRRLAAVHL